MIFCPPITLILNVGHYHYCISCVYLTIARFFPFFDQFVINGGFRGYYKINFYALILLSFN